MNATVGKDERKVKARTRLAALLVHFLDERCKLLQCGVHPRVDLHLLRRHITATVLIYVMVTAIVVDEDTQQEWTFLNWRLKSNEKSEHQVNGNQSNVSTFSRSTVSVVLLVTTDEAIFRLKT